MIKKPRTTEKNNRGDNARRETETAFHDGIGETLVGPALPSSHQPPDCLFSNQNVCEFEAHLRLRMSSEDTGAGFAGAEDMLLFRFWTVAGVQRPLEFVRLFAWCCGSPNLSLSKS